MVGGEVAANAGKHATGFATCGFNFGALASQTVHVGSGATQIGNDACKAFHLVADVFNFAKHGGFTATLNDAAFVLCDRAKSAASKTAAHDVD